MTAIEIIDNAINAQISIRRRADWLIAMSRQRKYHYKKRKFDTDYFIYEYINAAENKKALEFVKGVLLKAGA
jgi:hypothetical protein